VNTYIQGAYNQVATLYNNDGISTNLQTLFIWDTVDPYTGTTTSNYLTQFGQNRTSFAGDVAMLIGYNGGGGVAYVNGLCSSSNQYRMGYSAISSTYQNVPTYSWTVEVLTHEGGHLLGSRHTHDCVWNGNNTRIDGCGPAAGYNSGTCAAGPLPVSGTIMSYCHLVSGVGINFNNGFGTQPTSAIVSTINNATCLTSCISCPTPSTPGAIAISGGSNLICPGDSRTLSIATVSGATSYNWIVPSGCTILSGQGTISINVSFSSSYPSSGNITVAAVNSCGTSGNASTTIGRNAPSSPSVISGTTIGACAVAGLPYSVVLDNTITSYNWSFSSIDGTITSGQGTSAITASFNTGTASLTLSVTATNSCGTSSARTLSISRTPALPGPITGTPTPCRNQQGVPYSITPVASATSYRWTVPSGARIVAGGVTSSSTALVTSFANVSVNFKTSTGNVSVRANNACGSSAYRSLAITFPCRDDGSILTGMDELMVNPNIVTEMLQLQFNASSESQVRIAIMDISGRIVYLSSGEVNVGESQMGIDVSALSQGIYSIQAEFNGVARSARFIKK
ncbi:MAG: M12 family metallo-peptidase, partial [Bacteroidota bacterium]